MKKLSVLFKKLTVRLYCLILILVIPVNLLAVCLTQMIVWDYQKELRQSYQHELDIFYTQFNNDLIKLQSDILSLISVEWNSVYNEYNLNTALKTNQFYNELKDLCYQYDLIDYVYLFQYSTDRIFLAYDPQKHTWQEMTELKDCLSGETREWRNQFGYPVVTLDGQIYLVINSAQQNASFGVLISLERMFGLFGERTDTDHVSTILTDENGNVEYASNPELIGQQTEQAAMCLLSDSFISGHRAGFWMENAYFFATVPFYYSLLMGLSIFSIVIIPIIWLVIRRDVTKPIGVIENAMREISEDNLEYRVEESASTNEFQYLYTSFNNMASDLKNLTIDNYEKELEKLNLERNSLLLQVSPHMLLNSLNMIYSLSLSKNHLAIQKFTYNLMQYFRYVLRENREFVTLQEELEFIQSYLGIQKMRYPDRFTYVYQMEDDLSEIMIPPFLIENFVENAIKYGLMPDRVVEIILSIRREDDMLCISLIDTGNGMDEQRLLALNNGSVIEDEAGKHIGIWNCRKRIQMYFGKDADLHFTSTLHQGTQVWMALPYKELDVNQD